LGEKYEKRKRKWGKILEKRKKGGNVREKGRKRKEKQKEKMGSKGYNK
jgi:hypothetical protein